MNLIDGIETDGMVTHGDFASSYWTRYDKTKLWLSKNVHILVLWLKANFRTGFRKRKFGKNHVFNLFSAKN